MVLPQASIGGGFSIYLAIVVQHVVPTGRRAVRQHPARVLQAVASKQDDHASAHCCRACTCQVLGETLAASGQLHAQAQAHIGLGRTCSGC